jgi:hypothetical protein
LRKPYRIAIAGSGGLGACAIREIHRLPEYSLLGPDHPGELGLSPRRTLETVVAITQAIPAVIAATPGVLLPALSQFYWKPDQRI